MDNKRNIIAMTVVIALCFLYLEIVWPWLAKKNHWINEKPPEPQTPTTQVAAATPSTKASTQATTGPAATQAVATDTGRHAEGGKTEQTITIGTTDFNDETKPASPYPMGMTLSSRGAAIESVTLNRYHEAVDQPGPYVFQKPQPYDSPLAKALATRWIVVDSTPAVALDSLDWKLATSASPGSANSKATFEADVKDDKAALLRLIKTYEIRQASDKTAGYEVLVSYEVQNKTSAAHNVRFGFNGPTVPHAENNRDVPEVIGGFDGGRVNVVVEHNATSTVKPETPLDVKAMSKQPFLWSGFVSVYFDALVRPTDAAGKVLPLAVARAHMLGTVSKDPESVVLEYETADLAVPANSSNSFALNVFLGPKLRKLLKNDYYSAFPLGYDETLVLRSGGTCAWVCGLCTWSWLINILVGLLNGFHFVLRDWGLAIIALVVIVRLLLHPITKSSQVSMSRMSKLGPEMERLKKKYGDDTEGLKKAQVEFYREQGIAPFLGCLPMFLQMPIWIALWSALQSTFEIRQAPFLTLGGHHLTWVHDLAQPDRLITFKTPISLFFFHVDALNLLPILMGIVFYLNQKLMPQPMALKPEQAQQQKMMQWMSLLMFPIFLYTSPSGLNLYIFTSSLIGIFESKRIRAHIKEKEEREASGAVVVDAPRKTKTGGLGGGLANFFAKMQQMAEEAKREQERQKKKKR